MGVFLQSKEATPCRHHLKCKLTPKTPCRHHVHRRNGHGSPIKNSWRFSKFLKNYETLNLTLKICFLQEINQFKGLTLVLLESLYKYYMFCFTFLVRPSSGAQQSHERAPKENVQMTLKLWKIEVSWTSSKVRFCAYLQTCTWPSNFWEMPKNASEITVVPKNIIFLKILNFVQSFVECEVSPADGIRFVVYARAIYINIQLQR